MTMDTGAAVTLLVQFGATEDTRTYADFDSVDAACDGVCALYERNYKGMHPGEAKVEYRLRDLFDYIDTMRCCRMMVWRDRAYDAHGRDWIKSALRNKLHREANQPA